MMPPTPIELAYLASRRHFTHGEYLAGVAPMPFRGLSGILIKPRVRVKMWRDPPVPFPGVVVAYAGKDRAYYGDQARAMAEFERCGVHA